MKTVVLEPSSRKAKKLMVTFVDSGLVVHFGARGMSDYTKHKDKRRKEAYIKRHKPREKWNDHNTAGFWAKHILWNKTSIKASVADVKKQYNLNILNRVNS